LGKSALARQVVQSKKVPDEVASEVPSTAVAKGGEVILRNARRKKKIHLFSRPPGPERKKKKAHLCPGGSKAQIAL